MSKTSIEWTERTWNPVRGCSRISEGCRHCYAERMAARQLPGHRFSDGSPLAVIGSDGPHWTGRMELIESMLDVPLRRKKPTTWFVNSMSDLFHEDLPDEAIDRVFAVIALCPQHTFQCLTKRADRMEKYLSFSPSDAFPNASEMYQRVLRAADGIRQDRPWLCSIPISDPVKWPLPNVWLGVSVENQAAADERIPNLLETPAAIRFLSLEPTLGPVDIARYLQPYWTPQKGVDNPPWVDWVIVGGESGPDARPCDIAWIRSIVRQCADAAVPCFVKQLGAHARLNDRKGGDPDEWPEDLRIRQMPKEVHA